MINYLHSIEVVIMIQSIIFIISVIFLFTGIMFIKKKDEKLNFIVWLSLSIMLFFCYQAIISLILSILNIHIYLWILSVINFIIGMLLILRFKQNRQKYYIKKTDIIISILLLLIVFFVGYKRFGLPINITYETCDAGTHFWTAHDFYEQSFLLNKVVDKTVVNFETRQFASYVNLGILFKVASPLYSGVGLYKVYVLFDILMLYIAAICFYSLIRNNYANLKSIILFCGTVLYVLGYPLNNMLFGFFYSGHAITLIIIMLLIQHLYKENIIKRKLYIIFLTTLNFGLFFTYYFFSPVIFISFFLDEIITKKIKCEKIFSMHFIKELCIIFVIPILIGFAYFVFPNIGNSNTTVSTQINLDGYFYNNVYGNFILFIPLVLFNISNCWKKRHYDFPTICLFILLVFMELILCAITFGYAVPYYLSKTYYLLWLLIFVVCFEFISKNYDKYKSSINIYLCFILIIAYLSAIGLEEKIIDLNNWTLNKREPSNVLDIYNYNYDLISNNEIILTSAEIETLDKLYKMRLYDIATNDCDRFNYRKLWIYAVFRRKKITDTTENKLYDYISNEYGISLGSSFTFSELAIDNYSNYLLFFREYDTDYHLNYKNVESVPNYILDKYIPRRYLSRIDNKKNFYLNLNKGECINCKISIFDNAMLIIKEK